MELIGTFSGSCIDCFSLSCAICSGASNSGGPFSSSCLNSSLELFLQGLNLSFEVCACIKFVLVVIVVMEFMLIEVDNIVMLFFCLSEEEFVVSVAESTESM